MPSLSKVLEVSSCDVIIVALVEKTKGYPLYLLPVVLIAAHLPIVLKRKTPVTTMAAMFTQERQHPQMVPIMRLWKFEAPNVSRSELTATSASVMPQSV